MHAVKQYSMCKFLSFMCVLCEISSDRKCCFESTTFSSRVSKAFCRSCFLFLVGKWMGGLVKGGWWHSHYIRTHDHRILDDLHQPSRYCHCWAKTVRRAPTNTPSLSGTLPWSSRLLSTTIPCPSAGVSGEWCVRWRSCCFVTCSAVHSERTGYFLPGQLVVLAFDARMAWTV